ncbi:hypothetical protein B7494_g400 [Chlorociboria aeruginascens]|nr:hypothetical protein B7494_g400 [Chlorociboria aeruginascens]
MTEGLSNSSASPAPSDNLPTLSSPTAPKSSEKSSDEAPELSPTTKEVDNDKASIASYTTFSSTVSLIKNMRSDLSKLPRDLKAKLSYKEHSKRDDAGTIAAAASSESKSDRSKDIDSKSPRARTAEAYMIVALSK